MAHADTFTYDLDSADSTILAISAIRWRISDKDATFPIFVDAEIKLALQEEGFNLKRAAAFCLEAIASNEALTQKVIKILQFSTDGAKVAAELRANAKLLRDQAENDAAVDGASFAIAETVYNDFTYRQRVLNEWLRAG